MAKLLEPLALSAPSALRRLSAMVPSADLFTPELLSCTGLWLVAWLWRSSKKPLRMLEAFPEDDDDAVSFCLSMATSAAGFSSAADVLRRAGPFCTAAAGASPSGGCLGIAVFSGLHDSGLLASLGRFWAALLSRSAALWDSFPSSKKPRRMLEVTVDVN
jgi:hypothetical protein